MRSTCATVAAIEQRVVALELRVGAAGGGVHQTDAPSPLQSSYAASPAREDLYTAKEHPYPAQEDPCPMRENPYPASPEQEQPDVGDDPVNKGAAQQRCLFANLACRTRSECCNHRHACVVGMPTDTRVMAVVQLSRMARPMTSTRNQHHSMMQYRLRWPQRRTLTVKSRMQLFPMCRRRIRRSRSSSSSSHTPCRCKTRRFTWTTSTRLRLWSCRQAAGGGSTSPVQSACCNLLVPYAFCMRDPAACRMLLGVSAGVPSCTHIGGSTKIRCHHLSWFSTARDDELR